MKKLLLINPVGRKSGVLLSRFSTFPPLSLAYVAAATPDTWEVKILDENFDPSVYEEADLVGLTAFSSNIRRAYEIADIYRARGTKVIIGGIHASMSPDEALQHADAVLAGEVEDIWEKILEDFDANRLGGIYYGPHVDLGKRTIHPRHDLIHPNYLWDSIQTSRGCPFDCNFCSVSRYLGRAYRQRSADDVLAELENIPRKYVTFVDDNLIGYSPEAYARAKAIFRGMIERKMGKKWWMQTSINVTEDEEIIRLAGKAGCAYAFIGFESIEGDKLKGMSKGINLKIGIENYRRVVDTFHRHGIGVLGAFVVGNDHESPDFYKRLADFLVASGIDIIQITLLTPLPGTRLFEQLRAEGRLVYQDFPADWDKYRFSYIVHQPNGVDADTIYTGNNLIKHRIYSFPTLQYRLLRSFLSLRNLTSFYAVYKANMSYRKGWLNSHYHDNYPVSFD